LYSALKTELKVTCVGCGTSGSLLVKAAFDFDTDILDFTDEDDDGFDTMKLDAASFYVELFEDLKATVNLELYAGASISQGFAKSVLPNPVMITPFTIGGILSIGPIFDFEVAGDITGPSGSLNMTYGAELVVPKGAKANLTWGDQDESFATGW
jgi:hypothetical protein